MRWSKRKICKSILGIIAVGLIGIQFFPVVRSNPPVLAEIEAPTEVMNIFRRACYDCHSNETVWPWYSHVAPVSWLMESDVKVGRSNVNFSEWNEYSEKLRNLKRYKIGKEVDEGEMPLWFYVPLHSEAKLSKADIELIVSWSEED
jgi:hypothetical protein